MVTNNDFPNLPIEGFKCDSPVLFKASDFRKAEKLGLKTVADVLNDTRVGSCKSMKAVLRAYPESVVNMYNYLNGPFKLPVRVDDTFTTADMLKQLFVELDELVVLVESLPFEGDTTGMIGRIKDVLKVVKFRYLHNLNDVEIEGEADFTRETSRTHHNKFIRVIKSGLTNRFTVGEKPFVLKFGLSDILVSRLKDIQRMYRSGIPTSLLKDAVGSDEPGILQFFLDFLDASLYSSNNGTFKGEYLVSGISLTGFDGDCSVLFDMISKKHEHFPALKAYLNKNLKSEKKLKSDTIVTMADYSGQFDIIEKDGLKSYQLKYEYLKNDDVRNERILFDNRGKFLSRLEMENEYNRRASLFGMQEKKGTDYVINATDNICCQNATWHWIEKGENVVSDPRPFIKQFVASQGGTVTFNQVRKYLTDNNISLKDSSIRSYLTGFCRYNRTKATFTMKGSNACAGRGDISTDIIKYLRTTTGDIYMSMIAKALGTSSVRVDRVVRNHPELFVTRTTAKMIYVSLNPAYTHQSVKLKKAGTRKEPLHRTYMRSMAVDILKKANGGPLPLKDLANTVGTVIAHTTFTKTVVYKVFEHEIFITKQAEGRKNEKVVSLNMDVYKQLFQDNADYAEKEVAKTSVNETADSHVFDWSKDYDTLKKAVVEFTKDNENCKTFNVADSFDSMNTIMRGTRSSLRQDSYFWLIQELLYKYLTQKTTQMEREFLRDNLAFKYEAFLSNYYYEMTGIELEVSGLATKLGVLQKEGLLPARYSDWSSTYTSKLVRARNQVHTSRRDMDSIIKSDIMQFLVLYLYTASRSLDTMPA